MPTCWRGRAPCEPPADSGASLLLSGSLLGEVPEPWQREVAPGAAEKRPVFECEGLTDLSVLLPSAERAKSAVTLGVSYSRGELKRHAALSCDGEQHSNNGYLRGCDPILMCDQVRTSADLLARRARCGKRVEVRELQRAALEGTTFQTRPFGRQYRLAIRLSLRSGCSEHRAIWARLNRVLPDLITALR